MAHRTTILLDDETYKRLKRRAETRGATVSEEIRAAVAERLAAEPPSTAWFLDLAADMARFESHGPAFDYELLDEEIAAALEADYAAAKASFDQDLAARRH
ncbi:MAG: CopG family transcriptional regulator [Chloroflexi bacterium]|nr:CopG family transcriptional regulator [Chloroflexota bacterium]